MSDYIVGFKKPPVDKRFKKGKSGNPKGRPKAVVTPKALDDLMSSCLLQEIDVTVAGKRVKKQTLEAVILRLLSMALGGDIRAMRAVIDIAAKHIPNQTKLEHLMRNKKVHDWSPDVEKIIQGLS